MSQSINKLFSFAGFGRKIESSWTCHVILLLQNGFAKEILIWDDQS